jgi:L-cysteine:1D-myo-inositol 2-amino-2-deoxy-alpha-D-glucopyranoside ligase
MPTHYVKATETIPTIIEITQTLLEKGFAYEKEGTVFFQVAKDPEYGKLSRYTPQQMKLLSKERGANPDDPRKENPLDFILWQKSEQGEPVWDPHQTTDKTSIPPGRPGWHIECTAMNYQYLGPQIDIHGGGHDLIYPHHESEIAQMEAFTGQKPFTRFWIHIGMVGYMGEKMSKSLGNLIMVSDLLKKYSPQAIRYLLLSHHYRTAWEFNEAELEQAEEKVKEIHTALPQNATKSITPKKEKQSPIQTEFNAAMDDDCNTPQALQIISDLTNKINNTPTQQKEELQSILKDLTTILRI